MQMIKHLTLRQASVFEGLRRDRQCDINDGKFILYLPATSHVMLSLSKYEGILQRVTLRQAQCDINDGKFLPSLPAISRVILRSSKYEGLLQRVTFRLAQCDINDGKFLPSLPANSRVILRSSKYEGLLQRVTLRLASVFEGLRRDRQCENRYKHKTTNNRRLYDHQISLP